MTGFNEANGRRGGVSTKPGSDITGSEVTTKPGSDASGVSTKPGNESGTSILNTFLTTAAAVAGAEIGSQLAGRPPGVQPALGNPYGNPGFGNSGQIYPTSFGSQGYGNSVYGNRPYGNQGYGNNGLYNNQGYGNQNFGNQGYGSQDFGYLGNKPSYGNLGNQGGYSGSGFGSGSNFGSGYSRPHHHRPHHSHHHDDDDDDDFRRSSLVQDARNEPIDQATDVPDPVTGSEPDQKSNPGAPSVDYIPIYWAQDPNILVFAPHNRESSGIYSATPSGTGNEILLSRQNPEFPENPPDYPENSIGQVKLLS